MAINPELLAKVESSKALRRVKDNLLNEISFRSPGTAQFDPILILMAISVLVQIIVACRKRNNDAKIIEWLRNARTLPRLRTIRLRRKLDAIWQDYCEGENCDKNVLFDAMLDAAEDADNDEINEIMQMAAQEGAA